MTIAESVGTVNAHAATEAAPSEDASPAPAPKTTGTATLKNSTGETPASQASGSQESGSQAPASSQESSSQESSSQESSSQAPASSQESGSQASANKESVSQASASQAPARRILATRALAVSRSVTPAMSIAPESFSVNDAATDTTNDAATYQTLTPGQAVEVGKTDGSGVTLSGSQVLDHFTNTVQNFNKKGEAGYLPKNKTTQPADENGVWQLTVNGGHDYTSDTMTDYTMKNVEGPQTAHVSFENDIDFDHDFTMTGALGIGTKTSGGADGVGIVFAPGDPEYATIGLTGGNLGVGGLKNAFAFVYDDHYNAGDDTSGVVDPGNSAYFGWRSTDASGAIQKVTDATAWKAASAFDLSNRGNDPLVDFTMSYNSLTKMLSVTIQNQTFTRSLADIDTSKGYSISIAASTGQDTNDYSAKIDSFTYTPKTASVNVNVKDSTDAAADTTTPVTANIGDTIYVFSTKAAAERAVAVDPTLDPKLVTVIPASTTNNVYLVDGDQAATSKGTVHYINDDSSIADGAYYSYTVTGDATQALTVPISQAFTANVTPVDSVTGDAIPGMDPIQVNTVAGKSVVIQVPGYTPVTVKLDAPAAGETVAQAKVKINTGTTPSTATDVANPIEHYYTATGETIDGTPVTANVTVGTNQSVTDALNATPIGEDGKPVTDGSTPAYTWSMVPNAAGTDSTDSTAPQDSKSILVPTKTTLDKWLQTASDNQAKAKDYQKQTQDIYDKFVGLTGITPEQKAAAQKLLDSVNDMYTQFLTDNTTATDALQAAEDSTDPETIFEKGQAGYSALANMGDTLTTFQNDLDNLTATSDAAVGSLANFVSWSRDYGQTLGIPDVIVGDSFGATLTVAQKAGFDNPDYYYFVDAAGSDTHVTPKDAGTYYFKLTDAGRTYLKSLTTNTNAGLYTSAALTINPVDVTPTLTDSSLQYGGVAGILPLANIDYHLGTVAGDDDPALKITQDDFEIDDANGNKVEINKLQVGGKYTIRYTDAAQATLETDKNYNFTFDKTSTATLTVTPREVSIAAANARKTYGDADSALSLDNDSAKAALVNGDDVSSLGADLTRETGENAGSYKISGTATANQNYAVTVRNGTFTIAQKAITVKANNVSVDYDGTAHQVDQLGFTIPDGALVGTDTAADLKVTLTPSAETNAGTYTISGSSTAANYAVTVEDGTLTIAQKDATITANAAAVEYGDALPTLTVTNSDTGLKTTLDNTDFEIFDNNAKAVATGQLQAGGDYMIRLTQAAQDSLNTANPNYKLSFGDNKLTVTQRAITVHIENGGKNYGDTTEPALTFTIPTTTATGQTNGTLVDPDTQDALGVTLTREPGNDAGTYNITGTAANDGNYKVSIENDGTFTIAPIAGTATVADTSVVYGDTLPKTVTVEVNGTTSELAASNFEIINAADTTRVVSASQLQAGVAYKLRLTTTAQANLSKANPNYTLNFVAGGLTVTKRPVTVKATDVKATYNGTAPTTNGFSIVSDSTLAWDDTIDALGVTLNPITEVDVETYEDAITGTANSDNYDVTVNPGTVTIAQAASSVNLGKPADVVYGDAFPTFTSTNNVPGSTSAITAADYEVVDEAGTVVTADQAQANGNYTLQLTQTAKDRLNGENPNYAITFGTNVLTVTKRPITVKATDVKATYNGTAPKTDGFSIVSDNGLVGDDTLTNLGVTLNPISEINAGTYTDAITGTATSKNYDVTVNPGTVTIDQAASSVNLGKPADVVYGDAFPTFTSTNNVPGSTSVITAADYEVVDEAGTVVTADQAQANGNYTLQLTQTAKDRLNGENPNYAITFGTNVLTVTKRPITVKATDVNTTYDGKAPKTAGFSIVSDNGLVGDDTVDALGVTLNPISEVNAGTHTDAITGTATSKNYDVTVNPGTVTIAQAASSVDLDKAGMIYGDAFPTFKSTNNVPGTTSVITTADYEIVDKAGTVMKAAQVQANGEYTLQLTQTAQDRLNSENSNYAITFGTNVLTVAKRAITVQVSDQQSYAGEANPQNDAKLTSGAFKDGEGVTDLNLTYSEPTNPAVGSYTIDATNGNVNYDVKVLPGQLTVLGKEKDAAGTTTITEKDATGNVVKIDKQWPDGSQTTYTYDPATDKRTVSEQKDGKQVDQQELTSDSSKVTLSDDTNTSTTVTLDPTTKQPVFEHDTTQTAGDTTTTKDADGNVVKVVKQWPDGNQTTYTYDPITGDRAVTEQKDGKPVDQQKITSDDAKTTLTSGDDVKTIVNTGKPGSQPTFEHDTTKTTTDAAGNVTATTKDDAGNVIDVTKQWTDGSTTKYTYDPTTGKQNVTEQKDGKTVDQKTITPDAPKATLSTGNGVETTVNAPKPGAEPTFDHETTKTDGDTTTTKDANGNVVKVVKQWPDDSQTTYTYDPASGDRTVTEQKDGKTDEQPIAKDTNKATVSAVDGAKTIVDAGEPGSQPTFEHDTTQTTTDKAGNVTATTKDDAGNVIDVTKQWTDGSTTKYTYDPATKTQTVTEQKDGKTVDQKTITPDAPKATLSTGNGVETTVNAPKPGAEPTFDHEATKTDGDTTTTKDADGNVIKVVKQWPDDSQTTYTYDPTTGNRTVTEQRDGKTVDQKTFGTDPAKETLASGDGVKTIVNAGEPGSQPTFEHDTTQTTKDDAGNITATTKDDAGNVIDVTKQWTDGSTTKYTYDPATKTQNVTEQKDGKTVDQKTITPDAPKATLSTGNGVETIVNAPKPGAEPTFDHETTQTTGDTTTTKDADGNVIKVVKQWPDDSQTTYTYDPTTGNRTVTEQKDGKTDEQPIAKDTNKATVSAVDGAKTIVNAGQPGLQPTFEHDTTQTTTDKSGNVTTTTKDADGNVIEVTKQWTDGSKTIYTSDPTTGKQTVTEQKDGKTVNQKTITPDTKATLSSGNGVETIVTAGKPGTEPTFEHDATKTTTDKSGNITTTTKDADGNVVKITKQWTDGSKTIYTSDPKTGKQTVTEQKDGKTVDEKTITPNAKATLSSGDGVETIVTAGQPGTEPTFEHDATKTTTDKSGNITTTTKDANGNVIKVTEQWTDGSVTTYTYDPATGKRVVTEQRDGKVVDQQTIDPDATKATLSSGAGVETIVNAGQPGSQPTFEHETIKTTTDKSGNVTATTTDANGNAVKVTKQWTDGSKTIYTYDPATGKRTVTEQRDGKTVDQQTIDPNASQVTLVDGAGGKVIVNLGKAGAEPSFTRQLAAQTGRRQVTVQKAGINQGKRASKQAKPVAQGKKSAQSATTNEVAGDVAVTGRVQAQPRAKSNQKQTELPQTGQKNESLLAEVGVVLLALLAVPFIRRRSH